MWVRRLEKHGFSAGDVVAAVYRTVAAVDAALAMAILAGGDARFPIPTYQPLLEITGGSSWPWGISIGIAAFLIMVHSRYANLLGLAISFLWLNLISAMFITAIIQFPEAGSTAPIPYAGLAAMHVALMVLKLVEIRDARGH